ncbi:extracellular solute-binding protein [Paenibacillus sp. J5C_2022]|uniref:extracellular solute-binding protein n=1 Tax=Paenibacillus sp. J5C2022 TaxID=2977129 RepID=UPI0021CF1648|nr:extracellular solute-binding protein [Paenibacillus sp. J5C2022]MCU6708849.1 extracellular solute-binding protein [Paenibacillus sp. J5C2022]
MTGRRRRGLVGAIAVAMFAAVLVGASGSSQLAASGEATNADATSSTDDRISQRQQSAGSRQEPYYLERVAQWQEAGVAPGGKELRLDAISFARQSADAEATPGDYEGESDVLLWPAERGWVEYDLHVEEAGLYEISVEYAPFRQQDGGSHQPVIWGVSLNGEYPYREAASIALERAFRDGPVRFDENGNQIRSLIEEAAGWRSKTLTDSRGAYARPLLWHLTKGDNTVRIEALQQPVAIRAIVAAPPAMLPSYSEVRAGYGGAVPARVDESVVMEAEAFSVKNTTSIQTGYNRDPLTTPRSLTSRVFNTVGGVTWAKGGQAVTWEFDIPEEGLYQIGFRAYQGLRKNLTSFRTISIDGQIPFKELSVYPFAYSSGWKGEILSDSEHGSYQFLLGKGKHSITLETTYEPYMPILIDIDRMSEELRQIAWEIRVATGNREDKLRVWNIEQDMPGMTERLARLQVEFEGLSERMVSINNATDNVSQSFKSSAKDLEELLRHPNEIPYGQLMIGMIQEKLEAQRVELMTSPLELDKLFIVPAGTHLPRTKATFFQKLKGSLQSLMYSFSDQNQYSKQREDQLNVWMLWGRDYVDELQQLADEKFTPQYGIKVHVNLIQSSDLLVLGKSAGILPDIALGIPESMPFDMALRNAAFDLSTMPGAQELLNRYHPGALRPYYYAGGYYGLPETTNFKVLFYRKDILDDLGLNVPDTWDDVYAMMPVLHQNEYNFYVDPVDFTYMFFQNGVELYTPDGLSTDLNKPEAFDAFKKWTDLFNVYGMERQVQSFYNQFRRGMMPVGIADFNMYMQLLVAAPEILNAWGIAPVPGTVQQDGALERWTGTTSNSMMLFNDTPEEKRMLAWQFLQWYASEEIQTEYGMNMEQYRGEAFRWNSANVRAFASMPWKKEDLQVILDQWRWIKEIPSVPGGYMSARELVFAWNRSTITDELSGGAGLESPRISLEKGIREIDRELARKLREFGFIDEHGNTLKTLDLPQITEPWKGADIDVE